MNSMVQQSNYLIGSPSSIEALAQKDSARLLVVSDTHGDRHRFLDIVSCFGPDCDALIFCGDGTQDICAYIDESHTDIKMRDIVPPVVAIAHGNCDYDDYGLDDGTVLNNPFHVVLEAAHRNVFVTHGHNYGVYQNSDMLLSAASQYHSDLIFYGHTHCAKVEEQNGVLILNPGSISLPRGSSIPSFAIVEFPGQNELYKYQFYGIEENSFKKTNFYPINF